MYLHLLIQDEPKQAVSSKTTSFLQYRKLQATTHEMKHSVLVNSVYAYFSSRYGRKTLPLNTNRKQRKVCKHNRALKEVTIQKKSIIMELKKVKCASQPTDIIAFLTIKLLSLISRLKKTNADKLYRTSQSWKVHWSCYKDFENLQVIF